MLNRYKCTVLGCYSFWFSSWLFSYSPNCSAADCQTSWSTLKLSGHKFFWRSFVHHVSICSMDTSGHWSVINALPVVSAFPLSGHASWLISGPAVPGWDHVTGSGQWVVSRSVMLASELGYFIAGVRSPEWSLCLWQGYLCQREGPPQAASVLKHVSWDEPLSVAWRLSQEVLFLFRDTGYSDLSLLLQPNLAYSGW